jgi:hypothetical protein
MVFSSLASSKRAQVPIGFFAGLGASLLGLLLVHLGLVYAQLGVPTHSSAWAFEINQKKFQRAMSVREPALLIAGGSGALFGIRAEQIEARLNYPTVNLSTHAALGTAYVLELARRATQPGDTVLFVPEYYCLGGIRRDNLFIDYILARDPDYFRSMTLWERFDAAMSVSYHRLRRGIANRFRPEREKPRDELYESKNLSTHGDQLGAEAAKRPSNPKSLYVPDPALENGFVDFPIDFGPVEAFAKWARTNGVRVLATYPNILHQPVYDTLKSREALRQIKDGYQRLGIPVVGDLKESMLPPSAFFDTRYHMTLEGSRLRTEQLIPHLAPHLTK